jgi:hypothetical protein
MHDISEADWKVFKRVREAALERFCERVLKEVTYVGSEPGKSAHQRYLDVFRVVQDRDKELAKAFDFLSRSRAKLQLAIIRRMGLVTDEELVRFSPQMKEFLEGMAKPW